MVKSLTSLDLERSFPSEDSPRSSGTSVAIDVSSHASCFSSGGGMTKTVLKVSFIVALMALGIQSRAEAVVQMSVRICQGTSFCQDFGPAPGPATFTNNDITVGDFHISGSVSTIENAA